MLAPVGESDDALARSESETPSLPAPSSRLWVELAFFSDSGDVVESVRGGGVTDGRRTLSLWAPVWRGNIAVGDWTLDFDVPMSVLNQSTDYANAGGSEYTRFAFGNFTAGARHHWTGTKFRGSMGGALALPTSHVPNEAPRLTLAALAGGTQTRGFHQIWWYLPETFSFVLPWSVRHTEGFGLDVGADGAGAIPVGTGNVDPGTGLVFDLAGHVGYASEHLEIAASLRTVVFTELDDAAQVSLKPYVFGYVGPLIVGWALLMNLDEPLGPFFDQGSVWGTHFSLGSRLW